MFTIARVHLQGLVPFFEQYQVTMTARIRKLSDSWPIESLCAVVNNR